MPGEANIVIYRITQEFLVNVLKHSEATRVAVAIKALPEKDVLHVLHDPFSVDGWNLPLPSLKQEYENLVKKARKEIDRVIKSEQADGLDIVEWIRDGKPAEEVITAVKEEKIDLVILAAHEEGRFEHFLFGRTVEELSRKMPCSILLVNYNPLHKV